MDCRVPVERRRRIVVHPHREIDIDTENGTAGTVTWAAAEQVLSA